MNTNNELNIDLSIRQFLGDILINYQIPAINGASTNIMELTYERFCYYFIQIRESKMGIPVITTDLTFHVRHKIGLNQVDTDGKWVRIVGNEIKKQIKNAHYRTIQDAEFPLLDYFSLIPQSTLNEYILNADLNEIAPYLTGEPEKIGAFWLFEFGEPIVDKIDNTYFDYGRNLTLKHYAPDIINEH